MVNIEDINPSKVYSVAEAAVVLDMHPESVRQRLKRGRLKGRKIGRDWRIIGKDMLEFVGVSQEEIEERVLRNTRIIALANQKGGTGKTTTAINLSAGLAMNGRKVLVIDVDPQANASVGFLGSEIFNYEASIYEVLMGKADLESVIKETSVPNLFIANSNIQLAAAEMELTASPVGGTALKNRIGGVMDRFDYIIIDCPPALAMLTWNALVTAKEVFIPIQTSFFPLVGIQQLTATIDVVKREANPDLVISGVILTLWDMRKGIGGEVIDQVRELFGDIVFKTVIRSNVKLEESPAHQKTVFQHAPRSAGAIEYKSLTKEVLAREGS